MTGSDIFSGLAILISAVIAGYVILRNASREGREKEAVAEKTERNGVIQGEREYSERLEKRIVVLEKKIEELYEVIRKMQESNLLKDASAVEQVAQIGRLQDTVATAKDAEKEAAVIAARMEGEKAGAAATVAAPVSIGREVGEAVKSALDQNVVKVKQDVGVIKSDVKDVKKTLEDK